jgi:hypothetical protein
MPSMTVTGSFPANDWNDGLFLDVYVLTGAAKAASQTGAIYETSASSADPGYAAITTTAASSVVFGVWGDPGASQGNPVPYDSSTATVLANSYNLPNGPGASWGFMTFDSIVTSTPGTETLGVQDASRSYTYGPGSIALAEILAASGRSIAIDASGPSPSDTDDFNNLTSTSASFTAVPGSLLIAFIAADANPGHVASDLTITDSFGLTWHQLAFANSNQGEAVTIFVADIPSSPSESGLLAAAFI